MKADHLPGKPEPRRGPVRPEMDKPPEAAVHWMLWASMYREIWGSILALSYFGDGRRDESAP